MMTDWKTSHKVATVLILLMLVAAVSYFAIEAFRAEHKAPQPGNLTSAAGQQVQQASPATATSRLHAAAPLELHLPAGTIERPSIVATSVVVEAPTPRISTTSEASSAASPSPPPGDLVASTEIPLVAAPVESVSQPPPGEPPMGLDTSPSLPSSPVVDSAGTSTERPTPMTSTNEQPVMPSSTVSPPELDPEATPSPPERTAADLEAWQQFKQTYNKSYANRDETLKRLNIFIANRRLIEAHNERPDGTFKLAINQMADMSREEINSNFIGPSRSWTGESAAPPSIRIVDEEAAEKRQVDLRNTTAQIVDQGLCRDGSVFAAVASIESSMYSELRSSSGTPAEFSRPTKYSERQVMDYLASQGQSVCSGAISLNYVFEQLTTMPGRLCTAEAYEQLLKNELGDSNTPAGELLKLSRMSADLQQRTRPIGCDTGPKLSAFMLVHRGNLLEALMNRGTLAVAVDASQSSFHFYKSGLYMDESCSSDTYNHHVLLVGYEPVGQDGEPGRQAAYLVRNSFGSQWGESGHMRMLREEGRNKCLPHFGIFPVTVADKLPEF